MTAWYDYPVIGSNDYVLTYNGPDTDTPHPGIDIETPFHTVLTAPPDVGGTIEHASFQPWGGDVWFKPDNGNPIIDYVHLDEIQVKEGEHIGPGQQIGLSGGQLEGGSHPITDLRYSTGPHTYLLYLTKYWDTGTPKGTIPYGPDITPSFYDWQEGVPTPYVGSGSIPPTGNLRNIPADLPSLPQVPSLPDINTISNLFSAQSIGRIGIAFAGLGTLFIALLVVFFKPGELLK